MVKGAIISREEGWRGGGGGGGGRGAAARLKQ